MRYHLIIKVYKRPSHALKNVKIRPIANMKISKQICAPASAQHGTPVNAKKSFIKNACNSLHKSKHSNQTRTEVSHSKRETI
jgi:hypothetical protein